MANVLGELFQDIADAIRTKTGDTATMKPAEFPQAIAAITGGSGEGVTTVLEEQTLDGFALDETFGAYAYHISPAPFTLTLDETYIVEWDGVTYTCPAQDLSALGEGHLGLGELANFGGSGNGEPFVIGWSASGVSIFAGDTETSHTLAIYQQASSVGDFESVFSCHNRSYTELMKLSSTTTLTPELTLTLPAGSKVQNVASTSMTCGAYTLSTSAKTPTGAVVSPNGGTGTTTVTEGEGGVVITAEFSSEIWGNFYFGGFYSQTVFFTLPGIYTRVNGDGTATLYADESATVWQPSATPVTAPEIIDLSQSAITALPDYFCYKLPNVTRVILPGAVTSIGQYAFQSAPDLTVVDASGCTAVPALGANAFTAAEGLQILVPAELYDEWVAAANWSGYAQYIVAV